MFERRGFRPDEARAVAAFWKNSPSRSRIEALSKERGSIEFAALAALLKRVKNITKEQREPESTIADLFKRLTEPSEAVLAREIEERPKINTPRVATITQTP
jgi:glycyl-tRNA synthetase beta subunit